MKIQTTAAIFLSVMVLNIPLAWLISEPRGGVRGNIAVGGVDVGMEKSYPRMVKRCREHAMELSKRPIIILVGSRRYGLSPKALVSREDSRNSWAPYHPEVPAAKAWLVGRELSLTERLESRLKRDDDREFRLPVSLDEHRLDRVLRSLQTPPKDASITVTDGHIRVIPDLPGLRIPIEEGRNRILHSLSRGQRYAVLPVRTSLATVTSQDLQGPSSLRAFAIVPVTSSHPNALTNAILAAKGLRTVVIMPGKVMSLNKTIGRRSKEKGFAFAPVFINQRVDMGLGGGICCVSSCVFLASAKAGLKIVERHEHSKRVRYAKPGLDATLNYGTKDLKVCNNTQNPVVLTVVVQNRKVVAHIFGEPLLHQVRLVTSTQKSGRVTKVTTYRIIGEEKALLCTSRYR